MQNIQEYTDNQNSLFNGHGFETEEPKSTAAFDRTSKDWSRLTKYENKIHLNGNNLEEEMAEEKKMG